VKCAAALVNPQRCRACGTFQPPDPRRDHFATLALPRAFPIDAALLERRVVEFGRELHPDLSGGDAAARTRAVLASAQLNEAFSVLRDDGRRAEYLLRLEGGPSASEDKSVPDGFLERVLEERAALEEALAADAAAVDAVRARFEAEIAARTAEIARLFESLAHAPDRATPLRRLRAALNVVAYYRGLVRDLREALRERN
jgi:Fe-S protein assembly co-chaperone HscB